MFRKHNLGVAVSALCFSGLLATKSEAGGCVMPTVSTNYPSGTECTDSETGMIAEGSVSDYLDNQPNGLIALADGSWAASSWSIWVYTFDSGGQLIDDCWIEDQSPDEYAVDYNMPGCANAVSLFGAGSFSE